MLSIACLDRRELSIVRLWGGGDFSLPHEPCQMGYQGKDGARGSKSILQVDFKSVKLTKTVIGAVLQFARPATPCH